MIVGFILGIGIAYFLSLISVDHTIIAGVKDLIRIDIGQSGYFLMMGVVGAISKVMITGFLTGLVVAYLFTYVNLDHVVIVGLKEWFKYNMTSGGYYLLFAIIGAAVSFLQVVRTVLSPLMYIVRRSK